MKVGDLVTVTRPGGHNVRVGSKGRVARIDPDGTIAVRLGNATAWIPRRALTTRVARDPVRVSAKMQDAIDRFHSTGGVHAALEIVREAERAGMKIPHGDTIHQAEGILRELGQPKRRHATEHIPTRLGLHRRDLVRRSRSSLRDSGVYEAYEFDLSQGERTGRVMTFDANSLHEAAEKAAYTLNLRSAGWKVGPSGRTVSKRTGDIGWNIVKAGSSARQRDVRRRRERERHASRSRDVTRSELEKQTRALYEEAHHADPYGTEELVRHVFHADVFPWSMPIAKMRVLRRGLYRIVLEARG